MIKVCSKESSFLIWNELDTAWVGFFFFNLILFDFIDSLIKGKSLGFIINTGWIQYELYAINKSMMISFIYFVVTTMQI